MNDEVFWSALLDALDEGVYFLDAERRILSWNHAAEAITGWRREEVLGRTCAGEILDHVDADGCRMCEGPCPAAQTLADGRPRTVRVYLRHRSGYRVPVRATTLARRDASGRVVRVVQVFTDRLLRADLDRRLRELTQWAMLDPLTQIPNRRYLDMILASRLAALKQYGWPMGILLADVDHFKHVNDRYGHAVGDQVLRMVAATLRSNCRVGDVAGRWGGEEFLIVGDLRAASDLVHVAERCRHLVASAFLAHGGGTIRVTVSIGATLARPTDSVAGLVERADRRLYAAKAAGRNAVKTDADEPPGDSGRG